MDETVDVQEVTIGVGTVAAVAALAYGTLVSRTLLGVETTALATGIVALTALAIAVLHGAYGRRDLAGAYALAGTGLLLVTIAASGQQVAGGLLLLVAGGSYVAVVTVRARREGRDAPS
ncbi:hypothetical protein ACFO5R_19035 [Halosolutus amylolyticus]|uniref:Uncharacterized protein n=1 Tax=Halosolutus amylolyticus TaxID=2932267 RepID=A0ABD5PUB3_9EURY|nr:hypothetical protein [Halosolutus amylolyticus]